MQLSIRILPAHQIDCTQWDACVQQHDNGLIYSQTRFLNAMADNWHGLIIGDYTTVMPIPWRKKWGIRYAYVPPFMQQQGFTGYLQEGELKNAMNALTKWISYGDFHCNFSNGYLTTMFPAMRARVNQKINLARKYADIFADFSGDAKRNIQQSAKENFILETEWNDTIWDVFYLQMKYPHAPNEQEINRFKQVCKQYATTQQCMIRWVKNTQNELLAGWVGLKDSRRIYNLLNLTTPSGRRTGANYFLINQLIQEFCEQPLWLDLEGSELPGVQAFYQNWGAQKETYFQLHINQLPIPLRWIKP